MGAPKKQQPFSLTNFIEQTARMLRSAIKPTQKQKKPKVGYRNRIDQIALLLRSKSKKTKSKKRKKD